MTIVTALTIRGRMEELLAASWTHRWALLFEHSDLVDSTVAAACANDDPFLALVIEHAADVGVDFAYSDFALARRVNNARAATPLDPAAALAVTLEGVQAVTRDRTLWITPLVVDLIEHLAPRVEPTDRALLSTTYLGLLAFGGDHDMGDIQRAFELCRGPVDEVWEELSRSMDLGALRGALSVVAAHLAVFDDQGGAAMHAAEVEELSDVAVRIGPQRAIAQHRLILAARTPEVVSREDHSALRAQSARLVAEYEATRCRWLLAAAYSLAKIPVDQLGNFAKEAASADAAHSMAWLARVIRVSVGAGIAPVTALDEALTLQRQAVESPMVDPVKAVDYRCGLATLISIAVAHSRLSTEALRESVCHSWRAVRSEAKSASRFVHLHTASAVIAEAVGAGVAPPRLLKRAVQFDREAIQLAPDSSKPACLANLGNRISQAAEAGIDDAGTLLESIECRQRAVDATSATAAAFASRANNLSVALARGVLEGVVPQHRYRDALNTQRMLVVDDQHSDHEQAVITSNLASRLSDGVAMGLLETAELAEALRLQTRASALTPVGHPNRASIATNMAGRLADAVDAGVVETHYLDEAVRWGREALILTPPQHPKRGDRAGNLGTLLGRAVALGALAPSALHEAVGMHREAVAATFGRGPHRGNHLSNLASRLAEAVEANQLPAAMLTEALSLQRQAGAITPAEHPDKPNITFHLGNRIADSVRHGRLHAAALDEALRLHRDALQNTPPSNKDYVLFVAELGCRLVDAVNVRLLDVQSAAAELLTLVDLLWAALAVESWSPAQRRMHLISTQEFIARAPMVIYHGAGADAAVAVIETLRNHLGSDRATPSLPTAGFPEDHAEAYRRAATAYRRSQKLIAESLTDPQRCSQLRGQLSSAINQIRLYRSDFGTAPTIAAVRDALDDGQTAIYLLAGPRGGVALPVTANQSGPAVALPLLTTVRTDVAARLATETTAVGYILKWLDVAIISPLAAELPPRNSWNFIPTGMLAMLPIHAAGSAKSGWIDDRVRISVTPSVLKSGSPAAAADAASDGLVAVSGDSGLPFLAADTVAAKFYHPTFTVLDDARRDDALQAMESASVVILGGHSREIPRNGAALWLSDGPLTAAHLARLSPRRRELALVCSCSGGRIASTLVDESIGLPHMLFRAGFTTVCASLWPVRDLVSFLFTCHLLGNSARAPATAYSTHVRASRRWLREVTGEQMSAFVTELTTALDLPFVARTVLHRWSQRLAPEQRVFPEPADWAAFAVYSMR